MNNNHDKLITNLALIGAGYFFVVKPIFNKVGITKSDDVVERDRTINQAANLSAWNPNFYKQYRSNPNNFPITWLTDNTVTFLATSIHKAWGILNDDEDAIYRVFRSLKSQLHLSQLADKYANLYNEDLLQRLRNPYNKYNDGLDASEFAIVADIVNRLPVNYRM